MNPSNLPLDILYEIANHLPFSSVANWALTNRQHYERIDDVLYTKLPRYRGGNSNEKPALNTDPRFRGLVLAWAASRGNLSTIRKILSREERGPWINEPVHGCGYGGGLRLRGSYGMTAMHQAARHGQVAVIDLLVEFGANVEVSAIGDIRPIHLARNKDVIRALVGHGSSIHPVTPNATPPLAELLCSQIQLACVKTLLDLGCNPNVRSSSEFSLGYEAVQRGHLSVLKWLLKAGLDIAGPTPEGKSLIYHAAKHHLPENRKLAYAMIELLLDHGAPVDGIVAEENDPVAEGCPETNLFKISILAGSRDIVELLLQRGADVGAKCRVKVGDRPKSALARMLIALAIGPTSKFSAFLDTINVLVKYGANVNDSWQSTTPLNYILRFIGPRSNSAQAVHFILKHGANMELYQEKHEENMRRHPIHILLSKPRWFSKSHDAVPELGLNILRRLLELGVDANMPDSKGETPLMYALKFPHRVEARQILDLLIKHGASTSTVSSDGVAPVHILIPRRLTPGDPEWSFREDASRMEAITWKSAPGALDVDARDAGGLTPLMRLVSMQMRKEESSLTNDISNTRERMVSMLLRSGADVHAKHSPDSGDWRCADGTALHYACYNSGPGILRLLLESGAKRDVNSLTSAGYTPLMLLAHSATENFAIQKMVVEMGRLLVAAGADLDIKDSNGESAVDMWVSRNVYPSLEVIVEQETRRTSNVLLDMTTRDGAKVSA